MNNIEPNGLDVAAIHPRHGSKYSPNLYKWLTMRSRKHHAWTSRVFRDKEGVLWIGFLDDGYFIGTQLMEVLCSGTKAESAAWCNLGRMTEIEEFWERYTEVGRCAIDPAHTMFFIGDETRWLATGDHRECQWCGAHTQALRRWMEPVERSAWVSVGVNDPLGQGAGCR